MIADVTFRVRATALRELRRNVAIVRLVESRVWTSLCVISSLQLDANGASAAATHLELRSCPDPDSGPDRWDDLPDADGRGRIRTLCLTVEGLAVPVATQTAVSRLVETLPVLESISILSVGEPDPSDASSLIQLHERCAGSGRKVASEFLLDDRADAFAALGGLPTSLSSVLEASRVLRERGLPVRWRIPLRPELVYRLEALFSLARDEGIEPILLASEHPLDSDERLFAWDFVRYRLLEEEAGRLPAARMAHYRALERALAGSRPLSPAASQAITAQAAEVLGVLIDGARGLAQWALARSPLTSTSLRSTSMTSSVDRAEVLPSVVVIGAYGGDHIGDAAILGGVLRRIHDRYQTSRAVLMSQRPVHSRHLLAMIEVPMELRVEEYQHSRIRACVASADAVVYAGGPFTDLPKQLVRHLYTASLARRKGKPFIVEGIGVGPYRRRASEWVGRRLARMAGRLSVRTAEDGRHPLVRDLAPEIGRDPAFDYLESRGLESRGLESGGRNLTRLPEVDRAWIDELLEGTAGRLLVGLNTRPIGHLFTEGTPEELDRAEHTRFIESRFEQQLSEALRHFDRACSAKPCFVFYPMNAIQFGQSDLRSAYRIQRLLGGDVDFRVWQGDASIDGVVSLLRRLDVVIAMRFHSAIFALSLGRRVIGIDYRPGEKDKVGFLLADFGQSENCTRIDELSSDWLLGRLVALAEARSA